MRHMKNHRPAVYLILIIGILLVSLFIAFIVYDFHPDKDIRPQREFEGGKLYKAGNISVLQLSGSYKEMGRQYGGLLKDEIQEFYTFAIEKHYIKDKGLEYEVIKGFSKEASNRYPEKFRALMSGISETSGLPLEKEAILEQILAIQFLKIEGGECSALAVWGNYTAGRPLLLGRNYDATADFKEFSPFLNVVVYNPIDDVPSAVVCYPGEITSFTGMNANGVFFEVNEGAKSGGTVIKEDRLILPVELVRSLLDYENFGEFDAAMNTTRSNYAFIVQVADKDAAWSYEASVADIRRRAGQEPGLLVATNDFVDPSWRLTPPLEAEDKSVQRRDNLLGLANTYNGQITPDIMMRIMDTPFEEGGATWTNRTAYQVIVEPAHNILWMKTRGIQDWVEIDLNNYFIRQGTHSSK
jgi:hypothetical protein